MGDTDDYLETTTLRQFLDAGGELVFRPEANVSAVQLAREKVTQAIHDALEGHRGVNHEPGMLEHLTRTAAVAALDGLDGLAHVILGAGKP